MANNENNNNNSTNVSQRLEQMRASLKLSDQEIKNYEKISELIKSREEVLSQTVETSKESLEATYQILGIQEKQLESRIDFLKTEIALNQHNKEKLKDLKKELELIDEITKATKRKKEELDAAYRIFKEQEEERAKAEKEKKKADEAEEARQKKLKEIGKDLSYNILSTHHWGKAMKEALKGGNNLSLFQEGFAKGASKSHMALQVLTAGLKKYYSILKEGLALVDRQQAALFSVTSVQRDHKEVLVTATFQSHEYFASIEGVTSAYQELFTASTHFTNASKEVRKEIASLGAGVQNLNVSATEYASIVTTMTTALGMPVDQMKRHFTDLHSLSTSLKVPFSQMTKEYAESMKNLSAWGPKANRIFKDMAIAARATNVSISSLNKSFGESMETFEASSTVAAKMNRMLGGFYIDSTKLLLAEPAEKQMMLVQALEKSGKKFQDMDRFTQRFLAKAINAESVEEARKLLGVTSDALMKTRKETERNQKATENFNKAMRRAVETKKVWAIVSRNLMAPFVWLLNLTRSFAEKLADWTTAMANANNIQSKLKLGLVALVATLGTLAVAFGTVKVALMLMATETAAGAPVLATAGAGLLKFGAGLFVVAAGAAILSASIVAILWGFSMLIKTMDTAKASGTDILTGLSSGFLKLSMAIAVLAGVAAASWQFLLALGGAILMMGAGIAVVVASIGYLYGKMTDYNKSQQDLLKTQEKFNRSLSIWDTLKGSLMGIVDIGKSGFKAIASVADAFNKAKVDKNLVKDYQSIANSIKIIQGAETTKLKEFVRVLNIMSGNTVSTFQEIAKLVSSIVTSINTLNLSKVKPMAVIMDSTTKILEKSSYASPGQISATQAKVVQVIQSVHKTPPLSASQNVGQTGVTSSGPRDLNIKFVWGNDEESKKAIFKFTEEYFKKHGGPRKTSG